MAYAAFAIQGTVGELAINVCNIGRHDAALAHLFIGEPAECSEIAQVLSDSGQSHF